MLDTALYLHSKLLLPNIHSTRRRVERLITVLTRDITHALLSFCSLRVLFRSDSTQAVCSYAKLVGISLLYATLLKSNPDVFKPVRPGPAGGGFEMIFFLSTN